VEAGPAVGFSCVEGGGDEVGGVGEDDEVTGISAWAPGFDEALHDKLDVAAHVPGELVVASGATVPNADGLVLIGGFVGIVGIQPTPSTDAPGDCTAQSGETTGMSRMPDASTLLVCPSCTIWAPW